MSWCGTLAALLICTSWLHAADESSAATPRQVIVVTGTYEPVPLEEADRAVTQFNVRGDAALANTLADFLRLDPSLDLGERAPNGVQTDLSIRGATFGQTLVLLNGMRLNDAQSGHHNMDIPVPLESVSQIEILRGSGSTLYGSDAVGGVVNILTRPPEFTEFRLRAAAGNFGVNQQRLSIGVAAGRVSQQFAFSRDFSSGFLPDRDYRNLSLSSLTHLRSALGFTDLTLAYNDRPFGADQFYGNFNSWERTRTWFASIRQELGDRTEAAFAFRRHTDLFVLYRDRPSVFTNRHAVEGYQAAIRRHDPVATNQKIYYGIEGYRDEIDSNNLGHHARSRAAAYASYDIRALRRFSFTLGAREELYRRFQAQFSPTAAAGFWISPQLKLRASVSRAFRLPSYTDLYYHDPANLGSPDLRPESAWSYEAGLDGYAGSRARAGVTVFQRRERNGIDYVRSTAADIWRAFNIQRLRFTGVEAAVERKFHGSHRLDLRYTYLNGAQQALGELFSRYAFNYPRHQGVASWQAALPGGLVARTRFGATDRIGRDAYALWDGYIARASGKLHPFFQVTNITGTSYQEIFGIPMPGRTVVGGIELVFPGQ
jgi:iron complex outermembrane receptor protein